MKWILLTMGVLAFGVMALADWLDVVKKAKGAGGVFGAGCLMLGGASLGLLGTPPAKQRPEPLFWILAVLMLALLLYTVFGAVDCGPARADGLRPLVSTGVYALCRHPGVLWLSGMYFWVWCARDQKAWLLAWLLFSGADILYVFWQDRWLFPLSIQNYREYQKSTPFLVPNPGSIRRCLQTLRFQ